MTFSDLTFDMEGLDDPLGGWVMGSVYDTPLLTRLLTRLHHHARVYGHRSRGLIHTRSAINRQTEKEKMVWTSLVRGRLALIYKPKKRTGLLALRVPKDLRWRANSWCLVPADLTLTQDGSSLVDRQSRRAKWVSRVRAQILACATAIETIELNGQLDPNLRLVPGMGIFGWESTGKNANRIQSSLREALSDLQSILPPPTNQVLFHLYGAYPTNTGWHPPKLKVSFLSNPPPIGAGNWKKQTETAWDKAWDVLCGDIDPRLLVAYSHKGSRAEPNNLMTVFPHKECKPISNHRRMEIHARIQAD